MLKPGHSLMDWIRLGHSGKDLTGVGGKKMVVSREELSKHNKTDDAWMAFRGKVYNITPYLDFHPGGVDELMRGAGKDGTALFDEIHKWVNAESMMEKCLIGQLKTEILPKRRGSDRKLVPSPLVLPPPPVIQTPKYDWYQCNKTVTIIIYTKWKGMQQHFVIIDKTDRSLQMTMYIEQHVFIIHTELEQEILDSYDVTVSNGIGKVQIVCIKSVPDIHWSSLGKLLDNHNTYEEYSKYNPPYRDCTVEDISEVSHDTKLITVTFPPGCRMCVPVGYHVHIRHSVEGVEVVRSYTVVLPSLSSNTTDSRLREGRVIHLMIKIYNDGALTPWLGSLKPRDKISVSSCEGNFSISRLQECSSLVMFAAGTGFTPMVRLMYEAFYNDENKTRTVKLMFFNKTKSDILWNDQLNALASTFERFSVINVLSEPDDCWKGLKGRVTKAMVEDCVSLIQDKDRMLICVCGPTPFTETVVRFSAELGYKDNVHAFMG